MLAGDRPRCAEHWETVSALWVARSALYETRLLDASQATISLDQKTKPKFVANVGLPHVQTWIRRVDPPGAHPRTLDARRSLVSSLDISKVFLEEFLTSSPIRAPFTATIVSAIPRV